ncbi:carotenoid ester lipase precursor [Mycena galopus ATCC 62051]|nr:carotenoid ester lipase precursor [Mycena galopus ATCC 62051]
MLSSVLLATMLQARVLALGVALVAPTVTLDGGMFTGKSTSSNTESFLGIPFAKPPIGDLRFRLPVEIPPYNGSYAATKYGPGCPQQAFKLPPFTGQAQEVIDYVANTIYGDIVSSKEDCLTINVIRPKTVTSTSKLPVIAWIFPGGFEFGASSRSDDTTLVERSITMKEPVIYVTMNHRVSAFGFLASKEVREAGVGNLGLQDQRQAFRWIQKYIAAFGGDPAKVTIAGESSGAISASLQMLANDGDNEGLFRGAFMRSGAPIPVGSVENGQKYYDAIVQEVGCSSAADTLQCLRTVPYSALKAAQDASPGIFSYQSLLLAWLPRADGLFLTDNPQRLIQQDKVANVPFVTGSVDDEGTIFSLSTLNITTDAEFLTWIKTYFLHNMTTAQADTFTALYSSANAAGSPFNTSSLDKLSPQFKRIAAFQGDGVFQAPRRFFQQARSGKQNQWAYLSKRHKDIPFLGSFHTSDEFNESELSDYCINFANFLDPNGATVPVWPAYTTSAPRMITFLDGDVRTTITNDTYRAAGMAFLTNFTLEAPL